MLYLFQCTLDEYHTYTLFHMYFHRWFVRNGQQEKNQNENV